MIKVIIFLFLIPLGALSKTLSVAVSSDKVLTKPNQYEVNVTIFGYNERPGSLILKIIGPQQQVILQNKKKIFGVWTWSKTGEFTYPAFYHFYSNKPSEKIDFKIQKEMFDNIKLQGKDNDNLKKDLIQNKESVGLFSREKKEFFLVNESNPNFFKIPLTIPYSAPTGKYTVILENLSSTGELKKSVKKYFNIEKQGLNSLVYYFAHKFSFLYGMLSAILAILFGLGAGYVFRKLI